MLTSFSNVIKNAPTFSNALIRVFSPIFKEISICFLEFSQSILDKNVFELLSKTNFPKSGSSITIAAFCSHSFKVFFNISFSISLSKTSISKKLSVSASLTFKR